MSWGRLSREDIALYVVQRKSNAPKTHRALTYTELGNGTQ